MTDAETTAVREATLEDRDRIVEYNRAMARETEDRELDLATVRAGVEALLEDPSRGRYFLAERGGATVGQAMVTYEWSDWRNGRLWWIQSVYVAPVHRRSGVYRTLHEHIGRRARDRGAAGLRLYVERENVAARRTYERLGMESSDYVMYEDVWV
jgi:GNAT superfamily N-acetyltransferase